MKLLEVGLIARAHSRGDPVVQIAPPLISDEVVLDEVVVRLRDAISLAEFEIETILATSTER